jgi:hypothetical protein
MIRPDASRAVLTVAMFFVIVPGLLVLVEPAGSAAFVISVATLGIGIIFSTVAILLILTSRRHQ